MNKLKQKWNIHSNFQLFVILLVFSINGSLSVILAKPFMKTIGLLEGTIQPVLFWSTRIVLMFIIYQFLLVVIGSIFGQHTFFWNMEKRMLSRLGFKKFFKR
ncbi:MAG: diacylglyceryl transferase [Flavobacteriaceae bacterium]|nr:diacylglyceryl transferase [Flavobacteriaceae bacterium]